MEWMTMHADALYTYDALGRMNAVNQWDGGEVPRFFLARSNTGAFCRLHAALPERLGQRLQALSNREPPGTVGDPEHHQQYLQELDDHQPVIRISAGPVYRFPKKIAAETAATVRIERNNAHLLEEHHADWLPDVIHRQPMFAATREGVAVAICASSRITKQAHEAGVETAPRFRTQGHASRAIAAWSEAVRDLGAEPLYSTSTDNTASQALAKSLGLIAVGSNYAVF